MRLQSESSEEDSEDNMETPFGKDDCSCPRCRRDSKELVKFNERDLKSSVSGQRAKQEHEEDSQSPSPSPP